MQLVNDVNAMAEDMERSTEFSILLISPEARGLESGRTEVCDVIFNGIFHFHELLHWNFSRFALTCTIKKRTTFTCGIETSS